MPDAIAFAGFLAGAAFLSVAWGRALWYFSERSQAVRRSTLFVMGYTRKQFGEVRAILLSMIYYLFGLLAALVIALALHLRISSLFSFSSSLVPFSIIGIVGEISLANLLIDLSTRLTGMRGPERFAEMNEVPWIKGLQQLQPGLVALAAASGGIVEEIFFRGVVLRGLTDGLRANPLLAIAVAGALFICQQLMQVKTAFQALVIGCGCVAISLVGGGLVVATGSIVPALIAHGSFVLFFTSPDAGKSRNRPVRQQEY